MGLCRVCHGACNNVESVSPLKIVKCFFCAGRGIEHESGPKEIMVSTKKRKPSKNKMKQCQKK